MRSLAGRQGRPRRVNLAKDMYVGIDETGWGAVAGPFCMAAVILRPGEDCLDIRDSKQIAKTSMTRRAGLVRSLAVYTKIVSVSAATVDLIGPRAAWDQACRELLFAALMCTGVSLAIVDGVCDWRVPGMVCMKRADERAKCVSAASIIAKDYRDQIMANLEGADLYGWAGNSGYGTPQHILALQEHGPSKYHRRKATTALLRNAANKARKAAVQ